MIKKVVDALDALKKDTDFKHNLRKQKGGKKKNKKRRKRKGGRNYKQEKINAKLVVNLKKDAVELVAVKEDK